MHIVLIYYTSHLPSFDKESEIKAQSLITLVVILFRLQH